MTRKFLALLVGTAFVLGASALPAGAKDGDVVVTGTCSGSTESKAKIGLRSNGRRTQIQFEIDQDVARQRWTFVITDNGNQILRRTVATDARGEAEVQREIPGATGHAFVTTATNAVSGETCTASASN